MPWCKKHLEEYVKGKTCNECTIEKWIELLNLSQAAVRKALAENASLKAEIKEFHDKFKQIMSEPCNDEAHCTCVPFLRTRLEAVREWREKYYVKPAWMNQRIAELDEILDGRELTNGKEISSG